MHTQTNPVCFAMFVEGLAICVTVFQRGTKINRWTEAKAGVTVDRAGVLAGFL